MPGNKLEGPEPIQTTLVNGTPMKCDSGGPGRPRREPRKLFSRGDLENAAHILGYGARDPPPCVCGDMIGYWFYRDARDRLIAECRVCKYKRVYSTAGKEWGPFPQNIS